MSPSKFKPRPAPKAQLKDFGIIAPLDEEFSAVRRNMSFVTKHFNDIPFKYYDCSLDREGGDPLQGLVFQPYDSGRVEASVLTSYMLGRFKFKVVALCGIAGGLKKYSDGSSGPVLDFGLGDVVFADTFIDTEFQKISSRGVEYRDRVFHVEKDLVRKFAIFWDERDLSIGQPLALAVKAHHRPEAHIGPVVSGSKVVASTKRHDNFGQYALTVGAHTAPLAIEMEGIGVAVAAWRLGHKDRFFMIRGISDFADEKKSSDEAVWRHKACNNAALTTVEFIRFLASRRDW